METTSGRDKACACGVAGSEAHEFVRASEFGGETGGALLGVGGRVSSACEFAPRCLELLLQVGRAALHVQQVGLACLASTSATNARVQRARVSSDALMHGSVHLPLCLLVGTLKECRPEVVRYEQFADEGSRPR